MRAVHSALILLVIGCAAAPAKKPASPLPTDELPEGPTVVRHNPARCRCPDWEVRVADRWERMAVEDTSPDGLYVGNLAKRARKDDRGGVDGRYMVDAELTTKIHVAGNGGRYRTLQIAGDPPPPEPVEAEESPEETPEEAPEEPASGEGEGESARPAAE